MCSPPAPHIQWFLPLQVLLISTAALWWCSRWTARPGCCQKSAALKWWTLSITSCTCTSTCGLWSRHSTCVYCVVLSVLLCARWPDVGIVAPPQEEAGEGEVGVGGGWPEANLAGCHQVHRWDSASPGGMSSPCPAPSHPLCPVWSSW